MLVAIYSVILFLYLFVAGLLSEKEMID